MLLTGCSRLVEPLADSCLVWMLDNRRPSEPARGAWTRGSPRRVTPSTKIRRDRPRSALPLTGRTQRGGNIPSSPARSNQTLAISAGYWPTFTFFDCACLSADRVGDLRTCEAILLPHGAEAKAPAQSAPVGVEWVVAPLLFAPSR